MPKEDFPDGFPYQRYLEAVDKAYYGNLAPLQEMAADEALGSWRAWPAAELFVMHGKGNLQSLRKAFPPQDGIDPLALPLTTAYARKHQVLVGSVQAYYFNKEAFELRDKIGALVQSMIAGNQHDPKIISSALRPLGPVCNHRLAVGFEKGIGIEKSPEGRLTVALKTPLPEDLKKALLHYAAAAKAGCASSAFRAARLHHDLGQSPSLRDTLRLAESESPLQVAKDIFCDLFPVPLLCHNKKPVQEPSPTHYMEQQPVLGLHPTKHMQLALEYYILAQKLGNQQAVSVLRQLEEASDLQNVPAPPQDGGLDTLSPDILSSPESLNRAFKRLYPTLQTALELVVNSRSVEEFVDDHIDGPYMGVLAWAGVLHNLAKERMIRGDLQAAVDALILARKYGPSEPELEISVPLTVTVGDKVAAELVLERLLQDLRGENRRRALYAILAQYQKDGLGNQPKAQKLVQEIVEITAQIEQAQGAQHGTPPPPPSKKKTNDDKRYKGGAFASADQLGPNGEHIPPTIGPVERGIRWMLGAPERLLTSVFGSTSQNTGEQSQPDPNSVARVNAPSFQCPVPTPDSSPKEQQLLWGTRTGTYDARVFVKGPYREPQDAAVVPRTSPPTGDTFGSCMPLGSDGVVCDGNQTTLVVEFHLPQPPFPDLAANTALLAVGAKCVSDFWRSTQQAPSSDSLQYNPTQARKLLTSAARQVQASKQIVERLTAATHSPEYDELAVALEKKIEELKGEIDSQEPNTQLPHDLSRRIESTLSKAKDLRKSLKEDQKWERAQDTQASGKLPEQLGEYEPCLPPAHLAQGDRLSAQFSSAYDRLRVAFFAEPGQLITLAGNNTQVHKGHRT